MTRTTYECEGCHATIDCKKDLEREQGTRGSAWRCAMCGTTIPSVVAEKIKHQK